MEIPKSWHKEHLGDLFEFIPTAPLPRDYLTTKKRTTDLFCIHYGDIHAKYPGEILDFRIHESMVPVLKSASEAPKMAKLLVDGDLVIADASEDREGIAEAVELRSLGRRKVIGGLHTIVARDKAGKTAPGFRAYLLRHPAVRKRLMRKANGLSVFGISKKELLATSLLVPPLPEQRVIANILGTWDTAIEELTALIDMKEKMKRGLMQQLLTGTKRLVGFRNRWIERRLGDLFSERVETGRSNLPLLSITADRGIIPQTDSEKKDNSNNDKSLYKRIAVGDIGYNTMRMWQGRSALSSLEGIVSPAYTVVIPKQGANGIFFSYFFKLPRVVHLFFRSSQGLVDDTLNCKYPQFAKIKVSVPDETEQIAIANILREYDQELELLRSARSVRQHEKLGLMQRLLTGRTRVRKAKS